MPSGPMTLRLLIIYILVMNNASLISYISRILTSLHVTDSISLIADLWPEGRIANEMQVK